MLKSEIIFINPLSANPIKWSNTLKQFVGKLPTNCLSVFDHFVKLAFKGLKLENQLDSSKSKASCAILWKASNVTDHFNRFSRLLTSTLEKLSY